MPTVSIVVPAFNCAPWLAETIASVLAQSATDFELIVVDDGSTDGTAALARSFGPPVRVVEQPNGGVCVARNRGLAEASGAFVAFLDHDDYWFPNHLGDLLRCLAEHPDADVAFSRFGLWQPDAAGRYPEPRSLSAAAEPAGLDPEYCGWIYHRMLLDTWVLPSATLARREVFADSGGFDPGLPFSEDWDLWLRVSRRHRFVRLRQRSVLYRQHPRQGSRAVRPIDYRTRIIEGAVRRWGLCSPDGQCVDRRELATTLARYHRAFALQHLAGGSRRIAVRSLLRACRADPFAARGYLLVLAALAGWRPDS